MRQFEYIPVTQALESMRSGNSERVSSDTVLFTALIRLLQTKADALIVEDSLHNPIGQVTLTTIYRSLKDNNANLPFSINSEEQVSALRE
jgi:signal-transduction protein with cAMP-binding, CBS, and nucleotidyltransferase domain